MGTMRQKITIVVPCYNEERRFVAERFAPLLANEAVTLLLVDDGSTDGTLDLLHGMARRSGGRCQVLRLAANAGKAEAVRQGLLRAVAEGADAAGYLDADGATPGEEMLRLADVLQREQKKAVVLAARVALAGYRIARNPVRHYSGRLFATCAALTLGCTVYDTQCGAKLFRVTPAFADAIRRPFSGRWAFDVDLLGRLLHPATPGIRPCPPEEWIEVPLRVWCDQPGSKLKAAAMLGMGWELARIYCALRRRRRSSPPAMT